MSLHAENANSCMVNFGKWKRRLSWRLKGMFPGTPEFQVFSVLTHADDPLLYCDSLLLGNFLSVPALLPFPVTSLVPICENHH